MIKKCATFFVRVLKQLLFDTQFLAAMSSYINEGEYGARQKEHFTYFISMPVNKMT